MNNLSKYAPVIVRIGMSLVFLWFGTNQLMHPEMWVRVVPAWATGMLGSAHTIVLINGWFETVLALTLLIGIHVRWVALILGVHLITIAAGFGLSPIGVRDFGLSIATLSIFFKGYDFLSLDRKFTRITNNQDTITK